MNTQDNAKTQVYGLTAEFDSTARLLQAARRVRDAGYRETDAFTPFPVHGLTEALGTRPSRLASLILAGGVTGCAIGIGLQYWVSSIAYPHLVAGRPFFSWPNFIPVVFECTVLCSALTAVIGMFGLNGLPRPYHPVFEAPRIELTSTDRFMIFVSARDPQFDAERTAAFLRSLGAAEVHALPADPTGEAV